MIGLTSCSRVLTLAPGADKGRPCGDTVHLAIGIIARIFDFLCAPSVSIDPSATSI